MGDHSSTLDQLREQVCAFRDARQWKQFHNPKDEILSLVLEATELLELTQWKNGEELSHQLRGERDSVGDELSDILYWVLLIAHDLGVDLERAFKRKMRKNEKKYPVQKARGSALKYNRLTHARKTAAASPNRGKRAAIRG